MRKLLKYVILFFCLLFVNEDVLSQAQEIPLPFLCSFEDSAEISQWHLNVGSNGPLCQDQWNISNLEFNEGLQSLHITCDTGRTSSYGSKPNVVVAYRTFKVPDITDGNKCGLDIAFDWKCNGSVGRTALNFYFDKLDRLPKNLNSLHTTGALPSSLASPIVSLYNATEWQTWISPEKKLTAIEGGEYYVMFVWQNNNKDKDKELPLGACVDNLQISVYNPRPKITNTTFNRDTIIVEWTGNSLTYEVQYRQSGRPWYSLGFQQAESDQKNKVILGGLAEGVYDIRVRGLMGEAEKDYSIWALTRGISFIPENHCINYIDLNRPDVTCEIGEWPLGGGEYAYGNVPPPLRTTNIGKYGKGPVNAGESSIASRHQVNWTQGVYDPRTDNKLRTIPEGALASVRLGNWDIGGETEAVTFEYYVDTADAKIILLKYAVVLENPGHGEIDDPYFKLEILNEYDEVLGEKAKCVKFDFSPENKNINWIPTKAGNYVWKDWTSIGINVEPYHGQKIKIKLITRDCLQYGHAGYAYFTLDCIDAAIKTTGCEEKMEMVAPEGFTYHWTKRSDPTFEWTEQVLPIESSDTATYDCVVEYIDVSGCGFNLYTSIVPRYPYSDFEWKWVPSDCENKIMFLNKGGVKTKIAGQIVESNEKLEEAMWTIKGKNWYSLDMDSVVFAVSKEGETLDVTLQVGLAGGCSVDTMITVVVPPIHDHLDTLVEVRCPGDCRVFNNEFLCVSGVYTEFLKNMWGCDSVVVLDLTFLPDIEDTYVYDTICRGEKLKLWGETYEKTGTYNKLLYSKRGCDSVIVLNLEVIQPLGVSLDNSKKIICADEEALNIDFSFIDSLRSPTEYSIVFDSLAVQYGFVNQNNLEIDVVNEVLSISLPDNCRPNSYTATLIFNDSISYCGDFSIPIDFDVYYSSSIMDVKFDNLISIFDAENNGGYEFVSYQWYKNNEPIEGALDSYLYLDEGVTFEDGDCYYLVLKRLDDGVVTRTCEYCFGDRTAIEDIDVSDINIAATILDKGQIILIENLNRGYVNIYSLTGQLMDSYEITSDLEEVLAPKMSGFYLLEIMAEDKNYVHKIWVR